MKRASNLGRLRAIRHRCKSQAFVEFAFILPIFLVLMMGVFDYSFMIMRMQIMAMAAREGANTATRQPASTGLSVGLNAAYTAARSVGVDFSSSNGGAIVTHVWYNSSNLAGTPNLVLLLDSNYVGASAPAGSPADYTDPMAAIATNAVSSIGGLYGGGTSLLGKSRILPTGITDWTWKYRQLPLAGTNLVDGDIRGVYAVEVMYTNVFITPIGNLLSNIKYVSGGGSVVPGQLYDAAFYGVITTQVPQSFVPLPPSGSIADSSSIKKAKRVHTVPGIPLAVHVTPGTGNNAATPAVPGHKVKTPKPGGFPGGGG